MRRKQNEFDYNIGNKSRRNTGYNKHGCNLCSYHCNLLVLRYQTTEETAEEHDALVSTLAVGDSILTTSGFFGVVIDIMDEVVIVEFGNNKNCRIPMKKENIVEIDKQEEEIKTTKK